MELSDYAQALGAAQKLVPNWREGDLREAQLATERMQPQLMQAQVNRFQAQAQQDALEAQQAQQYQTDLASFKRTPQGYRDMATKYPQFGAQLENAAKGLDATKKQGLVQKLAPVQSLISSGRYDTAAQEIKRHIDADVAAGLEPEESDQELYDELTSGDPARQKAAGGIAFGLLSALNPDTAASNLNKRDENAGGQFTLAAGAKRFDANGNLIASADFAPDRFTLSEGQTRYDNSGGGDPASGGGAAGESPAAPTGRTRGGWTPRARNGGDNDDAAVDGKIAGMSRALGIDPTAPFPPGTSNMQIAQALTLSEGGKGSIADRNNNPGNLTDPKTGSYRKFATKEAGLQAAAAQVARNRSRGQNTIRSMVEGLPIGGAGASPAAGGARVVATGAPKASAQRMTPEEVKAEGLDPAIVYYRGPNGVPQALSGQSRPTRQALQLNEGQAKATGLLGSMVAAQNALNKVSGYEPSVVALALNDLSNKNPVKRNLSQTDRRVLNAQLAFANSILRLESGAAIGKDEAAAKAQTLFPMPGDGPEVQADKRRQREAALASMRAGAGPGSASVPKVIPNAGERGPRKVRSIQEARALPPGTVFIDPRGIRRVR
jgi:hypothetical protein